MLTVCGGKYKNANYNKKKKKSFKNINECFQYTGDDNQG